MIDNVGWLVGGDGIPRPKTLQKLCRKQLFYGRRKSEVILNSTDFFSPSTEDATEE